jgi:REP element-mobilizing transposase RayT
MRGFDYSTHAFYSVTIVARNREHLFGRMVGDRVELSALGRLVASEWRAIEERVPGVELDVSIVMPDHFHGIIGLPIGGRSLSTVIGGFKSGVTRLWGAGRSPWQASFHDDIIRNEAHHAAMQEYILDNPRRWAAVIRLTRERVRGGG